MINITFEFHTAVIKVMLSNILSQGYVQHKSELQNTCLIDRLWKTKSSFH